MPDPIEMFLRLYEQATRSCPEPDAMVLSTVDADGRPSGRYVLLKGVDQRGFVFYTNLGSRKARALAANPNASLCFYWPSIDKQVRIEGTVEPTTDAEADSVLCDAAARVTNWCVGVRPKRGTRVVGDPRRTSGGDSRAIW